VLTFVIQAVLVIGQAGESLKIGSHFVRVGSTPFRTRIH
jgi:hypothetical protein